MTEFVALVFGGIIGILVLVALRYIFPWVLKNRADTKRIQQLKYIELKMPKQDSKDDKENVGIEYGQSKDFIKLSTAMNQVFLSLNSLASSKWWNKNIIGQDHFVCEYRVEQGFIKFVMAFPESFLESAMKQISAIYRDIVIIPIPSPAPLDPKKKWSGKHIFVSDSFAKPIRTMEQMEADPMNNILTAMSKIDTEDEVVFQLVMKPVKENWQKYAEKYAEKLKKNDKKSWIKTLIFLPFLIPYWILQLLFHGKKEEKKEEKQKEVSVLTQETIKNIEEKAKKVGFDTVIRLMAGSVTSAEKAKGYVADIEDGLAPYDLPHSNGFTNFKIPFSVAWLFKNCQARTFAVPFWAWAWRWKKLGEWQQIFSVNELSALFHFPNVQYNPSPNINWQGFKMTPPPIDMPKEGLLLGLNDYRGKITEVRIKPNDRMRHFYLIGKSGTGKSTILEQMIKQDLEQGNGLCLVDPHGDLVEAVLPYIPRHRAEDVIVFDPGDMERPMGVNILEGKSDDEKEFMVNEAMAIFIKLYGEEIFGPRLQNYFANACHTLMSDDEDPATILDILRIFTDDNYRKNKVKKVTKPSVKAFWEQEYAKSGDREKQEIIPYLAAKFTPFVTNTQIRNIIGQGKSGFDFSAVMNERKILLVNLSKGKLGDLNARLLGMIFVSKIQMAAMARTKIPEHERKDFYLYVDEFQNFVTESFASILSEARKYRLGLIVAHQYISQITKMQGGGKGTHEDHAIKDAVFGNVGSMMCFKIGAQDAETMVKEFAPVFSDTDLINIANYHAFIKLNINNTTSRGFVMKTIYDTSAADKEAAEAYKQLSRLKYARDRAFVEREIKRKMLGSQGNVLPGMEQAFAKPIF